MIMACTGLDLYSGTSVGLLGTNDNEAGNEFTLPNGSQAASGAYFLRSWQVGRIVFYNIYSCVCVWNEKIIELKLEMESALRLSLFTCWLSWPLKLETCQTYQSVADWQKCFIVWVEMIPLTPLCSYMWYRHLILTYSVISFSTSLMLLKCVSPWAFQVSIFHTGLCIWPPVGTPWPPCPSRSPLTAAMLQSLWRNALGPPCRARRAAMPSSPRPTPRSAPASEWWVTASCALGQGSLLWRVRGVRWCIIIYNCSLWSTSFFFLTMPHRSSI